MPNCGFLLQALQHELYLLLSLALGREASVFCGVIHVILFVGLLYSASWSKQKTNNGDNNPDNDPLNTFAGKPSHKCGDSTTNS